MRTIYLVKASLYGDRVLAAFESAQDAQAIAERFHGENAAESVVALPYIPAEHGEEGAEDER